jgi:hypothetical protein
MDRNSHFERLQSPRLSCCKITSDTCHGNSARWAASRLSNLSSESVRPCETGRGKVAGWKASNFVRHWNRTKNEVTPLQARVTLRAILRGWFRSRTTAEKVRVLTSAQHRSVNWPLRRCYPILMHGAGPAIYVGEPWLFRSNCFDRPKVRDWPMAEAATNALAFCAAGSLTWPVVGGIGCTCSSNRD